MNDPLPPRRHADYAGYLTQQRHRRAVQYLLTGVAGAEPARGVPIEPAAAPDAPDVMTIVATAPPPPRVEPPRPPGFLLRVEGSDRSHSGALPDGTAFGLRHGRTGIGRAPGSGIRLTDRHVSGTHAELVVGSGRLVVQDLGSTNGTFVNDRRIDETSDLVPGDRIGIGPDVSVVEEVEQP